MLSVSIDQDNERKRTFLRLKGVSRLLTKPLYGISRTDTKETLGFTGWEKKEGSFTAANQWLDGDDLCLELSPGVVAHFEPGRAIEIRIAELDHVEQISTPKLRNFRFGHVPGQPVEPQPDGGAEGRSGDDAPSKVQQHPVGPGDTPPGPIAPPSEPLDEKQGGGSDDGDGKPAPIRGDPPGPDQGGVIADPPGPGTAEPEGDPRPQPERVPADPVRRWVALLAPLALVVGLIGGFGAKFVWDEYLRSSALLTPRQMANRLSRLETDAFQPLSATLRLVGDQSPAGVRPNEVATPLHTDRGLRFYNHGVSKMREGNAAEGVYWMKQSVRTCTADAFAYLGDAYVSGEGVSPDLRTGFQLLRLASGLGSESARGRIIEILRNGNGVPSSMAAAYELR